MRQLQSLVAGTDFSACSRSALHQAARLARARGATLHVVHVIEPLVLADLAEAIDQPVDELQIQVLRDTTERLERFLEGVEVPPRVKVDARVGPPAHALIETVRQESADLLVLGAHGDFDKERGVGTLAARCARSAPGEVLLVEEPHTGPFQKIVACVDFSETSRKVVEEAVAIAAQDGAKVDVLHVYYGPWHRLHYRAPTPEAPPRFQQQYKDVLQEHLASFARPFGQAGVEMGCHLHEDPSYGYGIAEYAREQGADLVVVGSHGRTNLRYLLLGSTAERVLREATCSVLVVRPEAPAV
jgi:universal stress protein E